MKRKIFDIQQKVLETLSLPPIPPSLSSSFKLSQSLMRKVVTGDEKKRIRDLLNEKKETPQGIKLFDKISFTFFLLTVPVCQYFLLNQPEWFGLWFSLIMPVLLIIRYFYFCSIKMKYFLYDFCYFSNLLSLVVIGLIKVNLLSQWIMKMFFIFVNGPVAIAILIWRLSLVFHDFDRVTSIYIHILPAMLSFALRWHVIPSSEIEPLSWNDFLIACGGYLFWQVSYYLKTEVIDRTILDEDPGLLTSLRWLTTDKKNATAKAVLKLCRKIKIMREDEDYVSHEFKTKLIFMTSQFFYTILTFLPSFLLYYSRTLHLLYIITIYTLSVYNGASFYIEIFSQRYQLQFKKKEDMQHVVQAAAEIAYQAATAASTSTNSPPSPPSPSSSSSSLTPSSITLSSTSEKSMEGEQKGELPQEDVNKDEESERQIEERRKHDTIRHAIKKATSAFVLEWAASGEREMTRDVGGYGHHPGHEEESDPETEDRGRTESYDGSIENGDSEVAEEKSELLKEEGANEVSGEKNKDV